MSSLSRSALRDPWDEDLSILSTENVNFAIETAGLSSRFTAAVIDLTLQGLVLALMGIAVTAVMNYLPDLNEWGRWSKAVGGALLGLVAFIILWGYYFLFEWLWDGQTPGKRWLGLRVMQTSGMPISAWSALTRNLLRIADFLPMLYGVGSLVAILNPNNRRVGDLIAGTVVARERHDDTCRVLSIREASDNFLVQAGSAFHAATGVHMPVGIRIGADSQEGTRGSSVASVVPASSPSAVPDANTTLLQMRLNDQDYELLRDFLTRRSKLPAEARARLAGSLAQRLCHKLRVPPPPVPQTEAFLESLSDSLKSAQGRPEEPLR